MLKLIAAADPPAHLLLGSDAVRVVGDKLEQLRADFDVWKQVSLSTDAGFTFHRCCMTDR
jgi:hypothetical protein